MFAPAPPPHEAGIRGLFDAARRRWLWVILPLLIAVVLASLYTARQPVTYTATAQVLIADTAAQQALDPSSQNSGYLSRAMANEISLARSDAFASRVENEVGQVPPVSIEADTAADVLRFSVTDTDPAEAARLANRWAGVYVAVKQEQAADSIVGAIERFGVRLEALRLDRAELLEPLDRIADSIATTESDELAATLQRRFERETAFLAPELDLIDAQLRAVSTSISELQLRSQLAETGTARIVASASVPSESSSTSSIRRITVGAALGLIIGGALALLVDNLDRTIRSQTDVEAVTSIPVLGSIPRAARHDSTDMAHLELAVANPTASEIADGYHRVRAALQFIMAVHPLRSIIVTSASQSEGKTTTSSNLAWAFAAAGRRVVLADSDFHRPRLREIYDLGEIGGISDYTLGHAPFDGASCLVQSPVADLVVLPTGPRPPNPGDFVASPRFQASIGDFIEASDLVVIDAPPVLPLADALELGRMASATVLTARAGATKKDDLEQAIANLRQSGANIVGIVLVAVKSGDAYGRYGYGVEQSSWWRSNSWQSTWDRTIGRAGRSSEPASPATSAPPPVIDLRDPPLAPRTLPPVEQPAEVDRQSIGSSGS